MAIGDHLSVSRGLYTHHGIDIGSGRIIHYSGEPTAFWDAEVCITTRREFADGGAITVLHTPKRYAGHQIVKRARSRLGERQYHPLSNNCEHFANWCRSGRPVCQQAHNVAIGLKVIGRGMRSAGMPHGALFEWLGTWVDDSQPRRLTRRWRGGFPAG